MPHKVLISAPHKSLLVAFVLIVGLIYLTVSANIIVFQAQSRVFELINLAKEQRHTWSEIRRGLSFKIEPLSNGNVNAPLIQSIRGKLQNKIDLTIERSKRMSSIMNGDILFTDLFKPNVASADLDLMTNVAPALRNSIEKFLESPDVSIAQGIAAWDGDLQIKMLSDRFLDPLNELSNFYQDSIRRVLHQASLAVVIINMIFVVSLVLIWWFIIWPVLRALTLQRAALEEFQSDLELSSAQFRAAFFAIPGPACLALEDGRILNANGAFTSVAAEHVGIGENILTLLAKTRGSASLAWSEVVDLELPAAKNKSLVWTAAPAGDGVWLVAAQDVTRAKQDHQKNLHQERLRTLGQIAGGVAHDFNSLLANIMGRADLMSLKLDDRSYIEKGLDQIKQATLRGKSLTSQLQQYASRQALRIKPISLDKLSIAFQESVSVLEKAEVEVAPPLDAQVSVDANFFIVATENIVKNACDASEDAVTRIRISFETSCADESDAATDMIAVHFDDDGPGFSAEALEHGFDPFFSSKHVQHGTGLGLSMVKGFAQQCGGEATLSNRPDGGARVTVFLPRTEENLDTTDTNQAAHRALAEVESIELPFSQKKILVVEDEPELREIYSEFMISIGIEAVIAETSQAAIDGFFKHDDIEAIICDWRLHGGETSDHFVNMVRRVDKEVPIVIVTGYDADGAAEFADKVRCRVMRKPVSLAKIAAALRV